MPFVRFYIVHSLVCNISISITTFYFTFSPSLSFYVCVCVLQENSWWLFNAQYYYHPLEYLLLIHILPPPVPLSSSMSPLTLLLPVVVAFILLRLWFHYVSLLSSFLPLQHIRIRTRIQGGCVCVRLLLVQINCRTLCTERISCV